MCARGGLLEGDAEPEHEVRARDFGAEQRQSLSRVMRFAQVMDFHAFFQCWPLGKDARACEALRKRAHPPACESLGDQETLKKRRGAVDDARLLTKISLDFVFF